MCALAFADEPAVLSEVSRQSSRITHADPRCTYGCVVLNGTLAGLLTGQGEPLERVLGEVAEGAPTELLEALRPVAAGRRPDELRSSGYVVDTLQTALYHGLQAESAEEGIVTAVNMGEDTDTVGAVTGAVVGARFGGDALPDRWVEHLSCADELRALARSLVETTIAYDEMARS